LADPSRARNVGGGFYKMNPTNTKQAPLPDWYLSAEKRTRRMDKSDNRFGLAAPSQCDARVQKQTACAAFDAATALLQRGEKRQAIEVFAEAFVLAMETPTHN